MNTLKQLRFTLLALLVLIFSLNVATAEEPVKRSGRTVVAEVVAFDQAFMVNRLGSALKTPRIFALRKDVKMDDGQPLPGFKQNPDLKGLAGKIHLKDYKRARPIVLRANVGDILEIRFTNLLKETDPTTDPPNQPTGQFAGCHVMGLSLAKDDKDKGIDSDSSWVGKNDLVPPPAEPNPLKPNPVGGSFSPNANASATATKIYRYVVDAEGVFILYSAADPTGNAGNLNEAGNGLFGCVIVQPPHAEYYRSQVLRTDLIDATYDSQKLPVNLVLHLKPKRPKQPNEPEDGDHWFLTTYKTRLHDFVLKEVEVEIVPDDQVKAQTAASQPKEEARAAAAPSKKQPQNFMRNLKTGEALAEAAPPSDSPELRKLQEEGKAAPPGKLYAASSKHPLIDYPVAYRADRARPTGWPVLEMLYPEATSLLTAQTANPGFGIAKGAAFYKLQQSPEKKDPEKTYASAITQLDTGTVPRDLWRVLDAWGVKEMPDITRVAPQRDYFDLNLDKTKRIPREGTSNFIWLLTGVEIPGKTNASVIIHGDVKDLTLRFIEVELQLFHSDLTAIITGPQAEGFGHDQQTPSAFLIPASPERAQPYREFALGYHNGGQNVDQAFPEQNNGPLKNVLTNGGDGFGINYGMAGIATEILASRLGKGPEGFNRLGDGKAGWNNDGVDLKFEEFFLSSWAVGDPAMLVDRPANSKTANPPGPNERATKVYFADDPSNVYHSYMRDHVKMRIYNAGENAPHVHHLHAHQWLRSPNSDEASYLDSQLLVPGAAFSLEITYNGSGNRNQTVGDSIFHCHFYPHFAQGMWSLWRVHDVFEDGTPLDKDGKVISVSADPTKWVRALPDAEIETGTPIPAIVPLPTLAMPPIPPAVRVAKIPDLPANPAAPASDLQNWVNISKNGSNPSMGRMAQVKPDSFNKDGIPQFSNPGYPFFVPGVAGHRPPHPPLDMGWEEKEQADGTRVPDLDANGEKKLLDGGLPRHQVLGGQIVREFHSPWDFTKDYIRYDKDDKPADGAMVAYRIPEDGTPIEKAAMEAHRTRTVKTVQPDGRQGNYIHNGLAPISGAPFADPGVDDEGNAVRSLRKYKAAVIQKDVVFNKAGWHYPQQRFLTLWQDVKPTFDEKRPAQPFFFRANSGETVEYWHTNLVPEYYELDDFQVRTPTDIIGQHIHLVKFDVLASDGAVNGFNYEDGTISPDDVRGRIHAITRPFASQPGAKYSLFELSQPKPNDENYVAGIDWSKFVDKTPVPTPWKGSYLQKEMSQGEAGKASPLTPPGGQNWDGAMTTIQRFSTDPLLNNQGIDRTVRTVFTHDHFGPSTHQQAGLYAGFLVEPENSVWRDPVTGGLYYDPVTRTDGGPTGWEAIIEPQNTAQSYREFAIEFQDLQLAYTKGSPKTLQPMKSISFGQLASPIDASNAQTPQPNQKVKDLMVDGPTVNGTATRISLTEFLIGNGITLTNDARLAANAQDVIDDGPGSLYNYGPNEPAFQLKFTASSKDLKVKLLQGRTWASPGDSNSGAPGAAIDRSGPLNPQIISGGRNPGGTYSVNYRNEPLSIAVPGAPDNGQQGRVIKGSGQQTDMSFAFASIQRPPPWDLDKPDVHGDSPAGQPPKVPSLFARPHDLAETNGPWDDKVEFSTGNGGVNDGKISNWDPYTPLLRGYQGDPVQVRALVGAHTQPHSFTINGVKWLGEMKSTNSGLRNAQEMGISEHFEFEFDLPPASTNPNRLFADYLYAPSSGSTGQVNGVWGLLRSYDNPPKITGEVDAPIASLRRLPRAANPRPYIPHSPPSPTPTPVPDVAFTITAQPTTISYNTALTPNNMQNQQGIVYTVDSVQEKAGNALGKPLAGATTKAGDPLILRVKAGQLVKVTLKNKIPASYKGASSTVGLHSQLVAYDVSNSDGMNVGFNPVQTVLGSPLPAGAPNEQVYWWYAGDLGRDEKGEPTKFPRELGATNLCPAAALTSALTQDGNGLLGALIVEPANSQWDPKDYVTDQARILDSNKKLLFHDFVLIQQTNINVTTTTNNGATSAVNNQSADLGIRMSPVTTSPAPVWQALSNSLQAVPSGPPKKPVACGAAADPNTPVFCAKAGDPVRFRVLQPGGDSINGNIMFEIHGHSWQQEPWINSSSELGDNPTSNVLGADILVPRKALNILIDRAGGPDGVPGDYLYYNFLAGDGAWGIFRVTKN